MTMDNWLAALMAEVACVECGAVREPAATSGQIAICAECGTSLHVASDGHVERATARHLDQLTTADLDTLRHARGRIARPDRRLH